MRAVVHLDDAADDVAIAGEGSLPVLMAQHERRRRIVPVVLGTEGSPEQGSDAERLEVVPRHDAGGDPLRLIASEQDEVHVVVLDDGIERRRQAFDVFDIEQGEAGVVDVVARLLQEDEVLAAGIGQRLQDDRVDDAEDGSVGANPERHRDDDGEHVAGLLAQAAHGIADVLSERFDESRQPGVAHVVFDALDAAEQLPRAAPRRLGRGALPHVLGREHIEVELQLGIELALHGAAAKDGADALQPGRHNQACASARRKPRVPHGSCVWRIRVTASVMRAQFSRSSVSWRRPVRVRR